MVDQDVISGLLRVEGSHYMVRIIDSLLAFLSLFWFFEGDQVAVSRDGDVSDEHFINEL